MSPSSVAVRSTSSVGVAFPDVWRATELGSYRHTTIATGYPSLDKELPGGGWPAATLIELLIQQPGIGEMRLLQPALQQNSSRAIALVQPPHAPQAAAWATEDFPIERIVWVKSQRSVDALWAAEQILRSRSCAALVLWQSHVRNESLRRLHLAAQAADTTFWFIRPLAAAQDASPAPLRLALHPAPDGLRIDIVKRRGPRCDKHFVIPIAPLSVVGSNYTRHRLDYAPVDQRLSASVIA